MSDFVDIEPYPGAVLAVATDHRYTVFGVTDGGPAVAAQSLDFQEAIRVADNARFGRVYDMTGPEPERIYG